MQNCLVLFIECQKTLKKLLRENSQKKKLYIQICLVLLVRMLENVAKEISKEKNVSGVTQKNVRKLSKKKFKKKSK